MNREVSERVIAEPRAPLIRPAVVEDLDALVALVALEQAAFEIDRISRRQFR